MVTSLRCLDTYRDIVRVLLPRNKDIAVLEKIFLECKYVQSPYTKHIYYTKMH